MEEARKKLFEKVIKRYTLNDLVKHANTGSGQRNLVELISRYPGFGSSFKVMRNSWPEGAFYHVNRVKLQVGNTHPPNANNC